MADGDDKTAEAGDGDINAMLAGLDEANVLMAESPATVPMSPNAAEELANQSEDTAQLRRELHSARLELKTVVAKRHEDHTLSAPPVRASQLYQFVDLQDDVIQDIL